MEIEYRSRFSCLWCGVAFGRRCHTGRKPSYCSSSHRQRSYEARRRDLHRSHHPAPPPPPPSDPRIVAPKDYPAGRHHDGRTGTVIHALRGDGPANLAGHHLTLCGTWAKHSSNPFRQAVRGGMVHHHRCGTCLQLANQFPAPHSTDHFAELTRVRAHIARNRNRRREPWLRRLIDDCFPPVHAPIA